MATILFRGNSFIIHPLYWQKLHHNDLDGVHLAHVPIELNLILFNVGRNYLSIYSHRHGIDCNLDEITEFSQLLFILFSYVGEIPLLK